jgi:CheY-like chemotaxis protein/anti-sigma regulatory factor (Ser/Thr protein kinase)
MLHIINDIMKFSDLESNALELETVPFELDSLLHEVIILSSARIKESQISFHFDKEGTIPNRFIGDRVHIEEILQNLLDNAIKFAQKGEVSLTVRMLEEDSASCRLAFIVEDSGEGMTEEQTAAIFQPITDENLITKRRFEGAGFGLSIAKKLADLMSGTIEVRSRKGHGSAFTLALPLQKDGENRTGADASGGERQKSARVRPFKILVAEDNDVNQMIIEELLPPPEFSLVFAGNGEDCVNLYKKNPYEYDIILMDLHMPVMNGFEAAERIRGMSPLIPITAITADVVEGIQDKCRKYGIYGYISKPFDPDTFADTVAQMAEEVLQKSA